MVFNNNKLLILFEDALKIYAVKFDIRKNVLSFLYSIITNPNPKYFFKFSESIILILSSQKDLCVIELKESNYEILAEYNYTFILWTIVLEDKSVLFLKKYGIYLVQNIITKTPKKEVDDINRGYTFGYILSNGLILLHKNCLITFIKIVENKRKRKSSETVLSIENLIFANLSICSESAQKKKLFLQIEKYVIIF